MSKRCMSLWRFLLGENSRAEDERIEPNWTPAVLALETTLLSGGKIRTDTMDLKLKDDASAQEFAVVLKDKFGNVVEATGPLTVNVGDSTLVTALLSTDGKTLTLTPAGQGKLGATTVSVADAADSLSALVNVTVVAGSAAVIELDAVPSPAPASAEVSTAPAASADASASGAATSAASAEAAAAPADAAPASTEPAAAPAA